MLVIDERFYLWIITLACPNVTIENGIGKAKIVLVRLAAKSVGRRLLHQINGQSKLLSDSNHLTNGQTSKRCKVAGSSATPLRSGLLI